MRCGRNYLIQVNVQGSCAAHVELCRALVDAIHPSGMELGTTEGTDEQRMGLMHVGVSKLEGR